MHDTPATRLIAVLLAAIAFIVYEPSLQSDFVYDSRVEILQEGFITSLANLPAILSLKVLGMNLMLGARPGEMLYLMLNAAVWGHNPRGYHLCSNLLHAANVALLYILLLRLITAGRTTLERAQLLRLQIAAAAAALIFAVHPLAAEPVAAINFSSDVLVAFFTLTALLVATSFQPEELSSAVQLGIIGTVCAFAAVTVKESGIVVAPILVVYWFLFRRGEVRAPWFSFLGAAAAVSVAFLAARFLLVPIFANHPVYLGGSLAHALVIQPRLWVFMMGKIICPVHLSADYTLQNVGLSTAAAWVILALVLALQIRLALKSRVGALGVALFWLGLAPVSNFMPLNCITADRYYYLPLAGFALQLLAVLAMTLNARTGFRLAVAPVFGACLLMTFANRERQAVFATDYSLWSDTVRVSPHSTIAHNGLAEVLLREGRLDEAIAEFRQALQITPLYDLASNNLAVALLRKGKIDEAIAQWQQAVKINPQLADAHSNLGNALMKKGRIEEAIPEGRAAIELNPYSASAHYNLGLEYAQKADFNDAILEYQRALALDPSNAQVHNNLGVAYLQKQRAEDALPQFQQAVALDPTNAQAAANLGLLLFQMGRPDEAIIQFEQAGQLDPHNGDIAYNLGVIFLQKGQVDDAITCLRRAIQVNPKHAEAHNNMAVALYQKGNLNGAIAEFATVVQLKPGDAKAQSNLAKAQAMLHPAAAPK